MLNTTVSQHATKLPNLCSQSSCPDSTLNPQNRSTGQTLVCLLSIAVNKRAENDRVLSCNFAALTLSTRETVYRLA